MRLPFWMLVVGGLAGCPPDTIPSDKPITLEGTGVSGLWTGRCDVAQDSGSSLHYLGMTLDLVDDKGVLSGTLNYTEYYATSLTYADVASLQGTRTGNDVTLGLYYTTTTGSFGVALELVVSDNTMTGGFVNTTTTSSASVSWDCSFSR